MAAKFGLEKAAGGKRPTQEKTSPQQGAKEIPKVSQMQPAQPRPQRATTNAPGDCFVGASAGMGLASSGKRHVQPKDMLEPMVEKLIEEGIDVDDYFERACTVTGEWRYERTGTNVADRFTPKPCHDRAEPPKLRTLSEILSPHPGRQAIRNQIVDWIEMCDLASQDGRPKPAFETPDRHPIIPEASEIWWRTDAGRSDSDERILTSDDEMEKEEDSEEEHVKQQEDEKEAEQELLDTSESSVNGILNAPNSDRHDPVMS